MLAGPDAHAGRFTRIGATLRVYVLIAGLAAIAALTVPRLAVSRWHWAESILWLCLAFYAANAALRIVLASRDGGLRAALRSYATVTDAIAVLPIPIALALGIPPATAWLFGALWLLKLPAADAGFSLLRRVFILERKALASVVVVFLVVLFFAAVVMHLVERDAQPGAFGTLPEALYWAVTTLTTTGYGDVVPSTPLGHLIASVVMICGLAVFGLWTGILANGFAAESRRRDFTRTWEFVARVPFFRALSPAAIIEIAHLLRPQYVAERAVIVRKGRRGDAMYFIAAGEVEIAGTHPPIQLREGDFFGELALIGDGIRTATVVATVPTTLLVLELTDYRVFAAHNPELARTVEAEGARRRAELAAAGQPGAQPGQTGAA
jgi:voltage-gated potassium channel